MRTTTFMTVLAMTTIATAGCDTSSPGDQEIERAEEEPTAGALSTPSASAVAVAPDTTAEALWRFLQDEAYRENWALWPGMGRLYAGTEPHGMLLTTYVNRVGRGALGDGAASLPPGTIIVKENYMPDSTFAAATVMYKVEGYNPDHQDWLFAKYNGAEGEVEAFGRAPMCQACHQGAPSGYVYTPVGG